MKMALGAQAPALFPVEWKVKLRYTVKAQQRCIQSRIESVSIRLEEDIMKSLRIDPDMKEKWPQTRGWMFTVPGESGKRKMKICGHILKKDVFKKTRDAIFDYGVNDLITEY